MSKVKEVVTRRYISDDGFTFTHCPVENSLTIKKIRRGYEVRYLSPDEAFVSPAENSDDDDLFLAHYHRGFEVRRDKIITEDDARNWYANDFSDYEDGKFPLDERYWIFPVSALIHSGVWLSLGTETHPCDCGGWDTSHVGLVLVGKREWDTEDKARKAARDLVKTWNQYLSGEVYGIVKETFNSKRERTDVNSVWGYYGHDNALEALQTDI